MKKFYLLSIAIFFAIVFNALSENKIAVQKGNNVKFYKETELQKAINEAEAGSDVYVPFTFSSNLGTIQLKKRLNLYGTGYYTSGTTVTGKTAYVEFDLYKGADSSYIDGFNCLIITYDTTINNVRIRNCKLDFYSNSKAINYFYFKNCYINALGTSYVNFNKADYFYFDNCIFKITQTYYSVYGKCQNSVFRHCIFNAPGVFVEADGSINNQFYDCIFHNTYLYSHLLGRLNVFERCLCIYNIAHWGNENISIDCLKNIPQNNIFNQWNDDPELADYNLKATCPGKGYATDGTDLGIYGGPYPYKEMAIPINPHFKANSTATKTVDGKLEISIDIEAQTK